MDIVTVIICNLHIKEESRHSCIDCLTIFGLTRPLKDTDIDARMIYLLNYILEKIIQAQGALCCIFHLGVCM